MESREIFFACFFVFLFFFFIPAFATAFDGSSIEFTEFYLYDSSQGGVHPEEAKIPKTVFFVGGENGEIPTIEYSLNKPAAIKITLMESETRDVVSTGNLLSYAINFPGNYTLRIEATEIAAQDKKTVREISFTTIPKATQINIPESNELMVLALFLAITAIIAKD